MDYLQKTTPPIDLNSPLQEDENNVVEIAKVLSGDPEVCDNNNLSAALTVPINSEGGIPGKLPEELVTVRTNNNVANQFVQVSENGIGILTVGNDNQQSTEGGQMVCTPTSLPTHVNLTNIQTTASALASMNIGDGELIKSVSNNADIVCYNAVSPNQIMEPLHLVTEGLDQGLVQIPIKVMAGTDPSVYFLSVAVDDQKTNTQVVDNDSTSPFGEPKRTSTPDLNENKMDFTILAGNFPESTTETDAAVTGLAVREKIDEERNVQIIGDAVAVQEELNTKNIAEQIVVAVQGADKHKPSSSGENNLQKTKGKKEDSAEAGEDKTDREPSASVEHKNEDCTVTTKETIEKKTQGTEKLQIVQHEEISSAVNSKEKVHNETYCRKWLNEIPDRGSSVSPPSVLTFREPCSLDTSSNSSLDVTSVSRNVPVPKKRGLLNKNSQAKRSLFKDRVEDKEV